MHIDEWIKDVKAKGGVDTDGYYGKQCMDLYNDYCHRVLGIDGKTGADRAKNILNNTYVMNFFTRIDNTPTFVPQKGDICVWKGGTYGHVAICLGKGDVNYFYSIEQNWEPQRLTEEKHNYTYLKPLVFLRPKDQKNIKPKEEPKPKYKFTVGKNYTLQANLKVREGAGTDTAWKLREKLTADGKKNSLEQKYATLKKGTVVTVQKCEIKGNDEWVKIPSGWIAGYYEKEYLIK
jgi:hypothetical protein